MSSIRRGAFFMAFGLGVGVVTPLAAIGASVLLVPEASASQPRRAEIVFPDAPTLSSGEGQAAAMQHIELDDEPASAMRARAQRRARTSPADALLRRASAETAITLAALVAEDDRVRAAKR